MGDHESDLLACASNEPAESVHPGDATWFCELIWYTTGPVFGVNSRISRGYRSLSLLVKVILGTVLFKCLIHLLTETMSMASVLKSDINFIDFDPDGSAVSSREPGPIVSAHPPICVRCNSWEEDLDTHATVRSRVFIHKPGPNNALRPA